MIIKSSWSVVLLAVLVLLAPPALAIEFRAGQNVTIAEGEVIEDDLYITGDTIVISGTIRGDVVAAGREIVFDGAALGDLIAGGQGVVVNGSVGDDVRIAGMALQVGETAAIGDDLIGAGFSLEAMAGGVVAGSVLFSGYQALIGADVYERLLGSMAALQIDGQVRQGGEVSVEGEGQAPAFMQFIPTPVPLPAVAPGVSVGSSAVIGGKLVYTSPVLARGHTDDGNLVHIAIEAIDEEPGFGDRAVRTGKRWAAIAVVGLLFLLVRPDWFRGRADDLADRIQRAAGWGIGGALLLPVVIFLALALWVLLLVLLNLIGLDAVTGLVIVGGVVLALMVIFGLWLTLGFVAQGVVALWLGRGLSGRLLSGTRTAGRGFVALLLGCLLFALVALVPFIGGLVGFVAVLLGFGAVVAWAVQPVLRVFQ